MNQKDVSMNLENIYLNRFSHIYIENEIKDDPLTKNILEKFKNSRKIYIENYKDVFNRPRQNYKVQNFSQKLILAKKHGDFIYKGSEFCEDFGQKNFYYTSSIMNCIYNCRYCYLKGLYDSSNIVIFVNIDDFIGEAQKLAEKESIYLCISYDSDLLSFEGITGFVSKWIDFAKKNKNVTIELRTKCPNVDTILKSDISENMILSFSILPDEIINIYEERTPILEERINAILKSIKKKNKVRLCIEPLIKVKNFKNIYGKFIDYIFSKIKSQDIREICIGCFRMSSVQFKKIEKIEPYSPVFSYMFKVENGSVSYYDEKELIDFVKKYIGRYIEPQKIFVKYV